MQEKLLRKAATKRVEKRQKCSDDRLYYRLQHHVGGSRHTAKPTSYQKMRAPKGSNFRPPHGLIRKTDRLHKK